MKVTVVVPVYNPGKYVEPCVNSLLNQSMSPGEFEVVFVDDGSTDDTPARLDELAAQHPHFRVVHQENSGWPGKPRNVGVAAARGEYVQFVDQDDWLGPRALDKLYKIGARNHADIVIGKVTSDFRGVPHRVWRDNVEQCTIRDWPLIDSLTPHKMFRTAFLGAHGIAYPEGRRRLEDQLYMVKAYFAAQAVSIIGDYPCYFYMERGDGNNAGSVPIDPAGYYANLREVLDVVLANTEPGEFRDGLLRRFLRNEMLARLSEPAIFDWEPDYVRALFDEVRRLAAEAFPDEVPDGLPVVPRARSVLVREDRLDDLVALASRLDPLHARTSLRSAEWQGGEIRLELGAGQWLADDRPLLLREHPDGRLLLDSDLTGPGIGDEAADATADVAGAFADVVLRNRRTNVEWFVPCDVAVNVLAVPEHGADARRVEYSGTARLDPLRLHGGHPLGRGTWDVYVRIHAFGLVNRTRLGAAELADSAQLEPTILGSRPHAVIPLFTEHGNLTLDVDEHVRWLAGEVGTRTTIAASSLDGAVEVALPVRALPASKPWPARLTLADGAIPDGPSLTVPAEIHRRGDRGVLVASLLVEDLGGPVQRLRAGDYELHLHSGTRGLPPVSVGTMHVVPKSTWTRLNERAVAARRKVPHPLRRRALRALPGRAARHR